MVSGKLNVAAELNQKEKLGRLNPLCSLLFYTLDAVLEKNVVFTKQGKSMLLPFRARQPEFGSFLFFVWSLVDGPCHTAALHPF